MENDNSKIKKLFILTFFKFLFVIVIYYFSILVFPKVFAADFSSDYQVEYNLNEANGGLTSNVVFKIAITNLRSDVYVNKFSIAFPSNFSVTDLKARDDRGQINAIKTVNGDSTKIDLEFSGPRTGKNSINTFFLEFSQANLFKVNGKIWEVVLPVMENNKDEKYTVTVNLPRNSDKKISVAKPKPETIEHNKITWKNPETKTIYAVFGNNQLYRADLIYHLKNDDVVPIVTEISFPPDTLYQKIYLNSIIPKPVEVYRDEDGNFLGKYRLNPLEEKTIVFKGYIEEYMMPREETLPVIRGEFNTQKNYLLAQKKHWTITENLAKINSLATAADIYQYEIAELNYNYNKIADKNVRLGADAVLSKPDQAVCLEYTDFFVAAAREKGIYSREIEGFGVSYDPKMQPVSETSDILHSWPEYYDSQREFWVPVDPTWNDTSGIDYFSSLDFNHIVFAIHGKESDYPLPAGMYKLEKSKDIRIEPATETVEDSIKLSVDGYELMSTLSSDKKYKGKVTVINNSNVYLWSIPVSITGQYLTFSGFEKIIPRLAPYEKKALDFSYSTNEKNKSLGTEISVSLMGKELLNQPVTVMPYYYEIIIKGGLAVALTLTIYLLLKKLIALRKQSSSGKRSS